MEAPTVLIADAQSRQGLATARSLGRAGMRVLAAGSERVTLTGCSRFVERTFVLPPPALEEAAFVEAVLDIVRDEEPHMVLPMTDRSLVALARHSARFDELTLLPFPDLDTVMSARDKSRTITVAREAGIPVPRTVRIDDVDDLEGVDDFPAIVKPVSSSGSRGVRRVESAESLAAVARETLEGFGPFLVQEAIPGHGEEVGCYLLCDPEGAVVAHLLQRRLRSFPARGGPSTLRETLHDERILELSVELLAHMGWKGPAMVEWKRDPRSGEPKLMEVNPRFWGSLEGSIAAGVDFPRLTVNVFMGRPWERPSYLDGVRSRWLFPGDLLWLFTSGWSVRNLASFVRSSLVHDDVWSWSDPLPFFGSMLIAWRHLLQPERRRFFLRRDG